MSSEPSRNPATRPSPPNPLTPRPLPAHRPSPLDEIMSRLLALLRHQPTGARVSHAQELAHHLEVPREFVEALFTTAQRRGLIKPLSVVKGKVTWAITPLGDRLLVHHGHEAPMTYGADDD
ncbi:MAG: hypothetical protein ACTHQE_04720 [Thermomicrobiales bacterium]|jgi:hypothetical protein